MLHLIFQTVNDNTLLGRIDPGDAAVFLEHAVCRLIKGSITAHSITQHLNKNRLYVLADDLRIRGIAVDELIQGVEVIDYPGLVELSLHNKIIQSWNS